MSHRVLIATLAGAAISFAGFLNADDRSWEQLTKSESGVWHLFDRGSEKRLGTEEDLALIRALVLAELRVANPEIEIVAVRWVSASLVVLRANWSDGPRSLTRLLYVVEKRDAKWKMVIHPYILFPEPT